MSAELGPSLLPAGLVWFVSAMCLVAPAPCFTAPQTEDN